MLLTGTFVRSVDEKLRIAIPKHFRDALGQLTHGVLYVAPGTDGSLALYTEEAFAKLAERLADASPVGPEVRAFGRLFYARAQAIEVDGQGRVRIPPELAQLAGLQGDAVLIGVQDRIEVWDRARWDSYLADKQARFDEIAEAAFEKRQGSR